MDSTGCTYTCKSNKKKWVVNLRQNDGWEWDMRGVGEGNGKREMIEIKF